MTLFFRDLFLWFESPTRSRFARLPLWLGLATAYHVSAFFILFPACITLFIFRRKTTRRFPYEPLLLFATTTLPFTLVYQLYFSSRYLSLVSGFIHSLHKEAARGYTPPSILEAFPKPGQYLQGLLSAAIPSTHPLLKILSLAFLLFLVGLGFRYLMDDRTNRSFKMSLVLALVTFALFYSILMPGSLKFTGFTLLPLILMASIGSCRLPSKYQLIFLIFPLIVFTIGIATVDRHQTDVMANTHWTLARWIHQNTPPDAIVLINGLNDDIHLKVYLPYFTGRPALALDLMLVRCHNAQTCLHTLLSLTSNRPVYALSTVFNDDITIRTLKNKYPDTYEPLFRWLIQHRGKPVSHFNSRTLYEMILSP